MSEEKIMIPRLICSKCNTPNVVDPAWKTTKEGRTLHIIECHNCGNKMVWMDKE